MPLIEVMFFIRDSANMDYRELERWHRLRYVKRASQLLVLVTVIFLITGYGVSKLLNSSTEQMEVPAAPDRAMRIDNFSYSSPGVHPWELKATRADVTDSFNEITLTQPSVVYEGGKGSKILVSAESGKLDRINRTVFASGDVKIEYGNMIFQAGDIDYSQEKQLAETDSSVSVKGGDLSLTGKGLRVSLDKEEVTIQQDVQAQIYNIKLTQPRLPL